MDDEQDRSLVDAYARLGTALAPPPDVIGRVERVVVARRARRRTALAGAAAVVLAAGVSGAVVIGHGSDGGRGVASDPTSSATAAPHGSLTLTRPDGSTTTFDQFQLSCDRDPEGAPALPGRIHLWTPVQLDASGDHLAAPYLSFSANAGLANGHSFTLPAEQEVAAGYPVVLLFAADAYAPGAGPANDFASSQTGSAGTVKVVHASCDPTPSLQLEVDTTLSSEVGQGTIKVTGSYP